jgi:hypothetical protein
MTALSRLPYRLPLQPGDAAPARSTDFLPDARRYAMHRLRPGELCDKQRLPSVWDDSGYLEGGGLASLQGDVAALFRRSARLNEALRCVHAIAAANEVIE